MKVHGMNLVFKMVGGSIAIYVAMAACSASGGPATGFGPPGSSKPSGSLGFQWRDIRHESSPDRER